jgi:hypothetical protein
MCFGRREKVVYVQGQGPALDGQRPMSQKEFEKYQKKQRKKRNARNAAVVSAAASGAGA